MKMTQKGNGLLLVPPSTYQTDDKVYLPLELKDEEERKEVGRLFTQLRNSHSIRGGCIMADDRVKADARAMLVMALAKQLLGKDWECEVLC